MKVNTDGDGPTLEQSEAVPRPIYGYGGFDLESIVIEGDGCGERIFLTPPPVKLTREDIQRLIQEREEARE